MWVFTSVLFSTAIKKFYLLWFKQSQHFALHLREVHPGEDFFSLYSWKWPHAQSADLAGSLVKRRVSPLQCLFDYEQFSTFQSVWTIIILGLRSMKNEGLQIKPRYIFWFIVYHVHADNVIFSAKYNLFTCMHKVDAEELIVPSTRARRGRLWALLRPTCVWNYNPVATLFLSCLITDIVKIIF